MNAVATARQQLPAWVVSIAIGLGSAGLGAGIIAWRDVALLGQHMDLCRGRLDSVESATHELLREAAESRVHRQEHERSAAWHIARVDRLEATVADLRTDARVRPDPFTGADGKRLEKRIEALEASDP